MRPLDRMVRDIENLKKAQRALATGPQLANSSLENGTLDVNDADGNLRMMVGLQDDGRQTVTVIGGPTPPTPSAPQVSVDNGTIVARWDGNFVDELVAPTDWSRTEIHAVPGAAEFVPTRATARDSIVAASGGEVTIGVEKGTWTVCLVSWSQAGKLSPASGFVTVEVPGYGDLVQAAIDEAQRLIDQAKQALEGSQEELAKKIATAETALSELKTSLGDLADTTLPKLREDLTAAEGRLDDAEQDLAAVPGAISGAVQSAADAAARFDAELKSQMDQALANARTALEGDISTVRTRVDGKNSITQSVSSPPVQYAGVVGDRWEVMSTMGSGGLVLSSWRWNGNVWVSTILSSAVLAKIDIGTGTFGDLDGNRLRVGSVIADKLLIGSDRNLIPNGDLSKGSAVGWSALATFDPSDAPSGLPASVKTVAGQGTAKFSYNLLQPVTPGRGIAIEVWLKADKPGSRFILEFRDQTGEHFGRSGYPWTTGVGNQSYPFVINNVATTWTRYVSFNVVPPGVSAVRIANWYFNHSAGAERTAAYSVAGLKVYEQLGGTLIEAGGIQTPHLAAEVLEVGNLKAGLAAMAEAVVQKIAAATASIQQADIRNLFVTGQSTLSTVVAQTIAADVAKFLKIEVGQLLAGTATMDQATVRKLFADVVVAGMAVATEFIGENAILTGAVTASKITASEELWAKIGEFVRIRTGMLEADAIDGMVITGATIQTARTGARVTQDASGLSVYDDADDWRVRLTPYGSTFKGDLEAESMVATGPAEFRHTDNKLGQGAKLVLEAGVTDPTAPPVVQPYWASVGFTPPEGGVLYGLAYADGKYWTFVDVPNASEGDRLISIDPATGVVGDNIPITDQFWASGGVTAIGSELFLLGQKSGTPYKYFLRVYSTAGAFLREWEYTDVGWSKSNPLAYKPGIGTDGTNVVIAQCADGGNLLWRTYNKTTGATIATVDCKDGTKSDVGGIYIGPGDWGGGTFVTVRKTSGNVGDAIVTFSTSGVWDPAKSWKTAENGRDTGLVFADGKFRTLNGGAGSINEYAPPTTGDDSPDWWAAYAWETDLGDDGSLDYDSRISPGTRFTWPRRSRLKVMGSPLPVGVGNIGGYTAKKATRPALSEYRRTFTHFRSDESVATWHYFDPAGMAATDANTYPRATPSSIASTTPMFEVRGDGSGKWGTLAFNANGTATAAGVPLADTGWIDLPAPRAPFTERTNGQYKVRHGVVYFRGQYSFTWSGMQTVMTLPPTIRPPHLYQTSAASNTTVNLYWEVRTDGTVAVWASGATGAWVNMTAISYPLD
ncbi:hypothetical protein [Brevibacterium sp. XM4083]|uniref:hypothetical protein n=1 Tax=Brevibacterium sp. XM4083 TaxID=2583238 RepID=UPI00112650C8|nr:hypothetical protein [Brevibacterium sp. XM4083]MCM1011892.1 PspA/IM30 family protein [Brevibacterium sp. XM4083]